MENQSEHLDISRFVYALCTDETERTADYNLQNIKYAIVFSVFTFAFKRCYNHTVM